MQLKRIFLCMLFFIPLCICNAAEGGFLIKSNPSGAGVYLNGEKLGNTPLKITPGSFDIEPFKNPDKEYDFIVYKDFFEAEIKSLSYNEKKLQQVEVNLIYLVRLPLYEGIFQEYKVLDLRDLLLMSDRSEYTRLKADLYSKYGKPLDKELLVYKEGFPWYKENPFFTDAFISEQDNYNLSIIEKLLSPSMEDKEIIKQILENVEYFGDNGEMQLIFIDEESVTVYYQTSQYDMYAPQDEEIFRWHVVDGIVYLVDYLLFEFHLDHKNKKILSYFYFGDGDSYYGH